MGDAAAGDRGEHKVRNAYKVRRAACKANRFYFNLEYHRNLGTKNPIVYSRFGKKFYNSNESSIWSNTREHSKNPILNNGKLRRMIRQNDAENFFQQYKHSPKTFLNLHNQKPYYAPRDKSDQTLVFESRFESGNLSLAAKISDEEYNLVLQNDVNTQSHMQWFYFRVQNTRQDKKVTFNIINMNKPESLYNEGMQILVFSDSRKELGWEQGGENISYFQNHRVPVDSLQRTAYQNFSGTTSNKQPFYYTLTFAYTFTSDHDTVYFAHNYPYTYSDLLDDMERWEGLPRVGFFLQRSLVCKTIAGNNCEMLTITSRDDKQQKRGVFISSRVHPSESNSSWVLRGLVDFLLGESVEAQVLRQFFVFKIIPMLNPDGVICGNSRCSLAGCDLNRKWKTPSKFLNPTVFEAKRIVASLAKERPIALICDMHGHSRRNNIFMYGNHFDQDSLRQSKLYPAVLSRICDYFSLDYSRFAVQKAKEATARVTLWRELRIPHVYTLETSFHGANIGTRAGKPFDVYDLMAAGKNLAQSLLIVPELNIRISVVIRKNKPPRLVPAPAGLVTKDPAAAAVSQVQVKVSSPPTTKNSNAQLNAASGTAPMQPPSRIFSQQVTKHMAQNP